MLKKLVLLALMGVGIGLQTTTSFCDPNDPFGCTPDGDPAPDTCGANPSLCQ